MSRGMLTCWIYVRSNLQLEIGRRILAGNGETTDIDAVTVDLIREFRNTHPEELQNDPFSTVSDLLDTFSPPGTSIADKAVSAALKLLGQVPVGDLFVSPNFQKAYNDALNSFSPGDPLLFDLNGDGVNTVSLNDSKAFFGVAPNSTGHPLQPRR
ncbi:hypothetical protein [Desulfolutivibrio sulfoxidireducens]|uniref:hypothetical protein n=1 Tax=Desulfolutivibrio sulfoxidireducens TaxID=2773299 RepID=UPI00159E2AB2|nr:hypothetical protein [Desulfolutivibrio sulfoxidireducens]QLA20976.1 hypothetical protein GD604_15230 [Desulfolutivibrio sulfoxidireducens]